MLFKDVLGQDHIKKHLVTGANEGRTPHAQLFVAPEGSGALPMAVAYAQYLLCANKNGENDTGNASCNLKFEHFAHPDLHFAFPVAATSKVKSHPVSAAFMEEWRLFLKEQPYGNLFDWYQLLGVENKQGQIGVDEAHDIIKSLSLKSYEGGYKMMLIWMAEKMHPAAANKLLKLIEEPPDKTLFILIAEDEEQIIQTIRSRCQILHFPPLAERVIKNALMERGLSESEAVKAAHQAQGNFNKALDLMRSDSEDLIFEKWFILWVRSAFKAKGSKSAVHDLINWSEQVSSTGRENQKQFLQYCLSVFRQALLLNYKAGELVYMEMEDKSFRLGNFAPFVHGGNILDIAAALQDAIYHIERNGNSKIILTDLSLELTRLLHKKEARETTS
ncbi:MAG: DNA polymerase III subunit delta' [Sinomicrobium sp.]|nr:DNA polymerase III subunit delta' [Sinomicrobium sp.]